MSPSCEDCLILLNEINTKVDLLVFRKQDEDRQLNGIKEHLQTKGYIAWADVEENPTLRPLFKSNTEFLRKMGEFSHLLHLEKKKIGHRAYFVRPGAEVKIISKSKSRGSKKSEDDLFASIAERIRGRCIVNVLDVARDELKISDGKLNSFVEDFANYVRKHCPDIERERVNGVSSDTFRVRVR